MGKKKGVLVPRGSIKVLEKDPFLNSKYCFTTLTFNKVLGSLHNINNYQFLAFCKLSLHVNNILPQMLVLICVIASFCHNLIAINLS